MWTQLSRALSAQGPTPVVTWLSPVGRIELSGKTLLNAVSKAGNYLVDGCGFDNQAPIRVELGNHWQAPVWTLAALVSGVGISDKSDQVFCFSDSEISGNKFVVSRDPFGMPEKNLEDGIENVSLEVRSHGDYFAPSFELGECAVFINGQCLSSQDLIAQADALVSEQKVSGRFGLVASEVSVEKAIWQSIVPALTGNGVVLLDGVDPNSSAVTAEKVTQIISL